MCIAVEDDGDDLLELECDVNEVVTTETAAGQMTRDALLHFIKSRRQ